MSRTLCLCLLLPSISTAAGISRRRLFESGALGWLGGLRPGRPTPTPAAPSAVEELRRSQLVAQATGQSAPVWNFRHLPFEDRALQWAALNPSADPVFQTDLADLRRYIDEPDRHHERSNVYFEMFQRWNRRLADAGSAPEETLAAAFARIEIRLADARGTGVGEILPALRLALHPEGVINALIHNPGLARADLSHYSDAFVDEARRELAAYAPKYAHNVDANHRRLERDVQTQLSGNFPLPGEYMYNGRFSGFIARARDLSPDQVKARLESFAKESVETLAKLHATRSRFTVLPPSTLRQVVLNAFDTAIAETSRALWDLPSRVRRELAQRDDGLITNDPDVLVHWAEFLNVVLPRSSLNVADFAATIDGADCAALLSAPSLAIEHRKDEFVFQPADPIQSEALKKE